MTIICCILSCQLSFLLVLFLLESNNVCTYICISAVTYFGGYIRSHCFDTYHAMYIHYMLVFRISSAPKYILLHYDLQFPSLSQAKSIRTLKNGSSRSHFRNKILVVSYGMFLLA